MPTKEQYRQELEQAPVAGPVPPQFKDAEAWVNAQLNVPDVRPDPYRLLETHLQSKPANRERTPLAETMKGALLWPSAQVADTLNNTRALIAWADFMSGGLNGEPRAIGENRLPSGDEIKEFYGLDPESGWGMVGEMFGGWESALAKGPAVVSKMFAAAMEQAPDVVMAGLYGIRGARAAAAAGDASYLTRALEAEKRLGFGENPAKVMAETGWYRAPDGQMKIYLSDSEAYVNHDLLKVRAGRKGTQPGESAHVRVKIGEVFNHPTLYKFYPELYDMPITVSMKRGDDVDGIAQYKIWDPDQPTTMAAYDPNKKEAYLFNTEGDPMESSRSSILHEVQHAIQEIEGFSTGADYQGFASVAEDYLSARLAKRLAEDRLDESGALQHLVGEDDVEDYARWFMKEYDVPAGAKETIEDTVRKLMIADKYEAELLLDQAQNAYEISVDRAGRLLHLGNESPDDFIHRIEALGDVAAFKTAWSRYRAQGGEMESRIVQFLKDRPQSELDRMFATGKFPEDYSKYAEGKVPAEQGRHTRIDPVRGARERITEYDMDISYRLDGNAFLPVMENPTGATEIARFVKKNADGATQLRYLKTEDEGLIIWDASEALHDDIARYHGIDDYQTDPRVITSGEIEVGDFNAMADFFNDL